MFLLAFLFFDIGSFATDSEELSQGVELIYDNDNDRAHEINGADTNEPNIQEVEVAEMAVRLDNVNISRGNGMPSNAYPETKTGCIDKEGHQASYHTLVIIFRSHVSWLQNMTS